MTRLARCRIGAALAVCLLLFASCSGGSDGGVIAVSVSDADFTPDAAPPGADSMTLQVGSTADDVVTLDVVITDTDGVFSAEFDLAFDPLDAVYLASEEGDFLGSDGADTQFLVTVGAGRVVVGLARVQDGTGTVPDLDVTGSAILASFQFRLLRLGSSRIEFDPGRPRTVRSRDGVPRSVSWSGGSFVGS